MNTRPILSALAAVLAIVSPALRAQVPQLINYQGRIAVGTVNFDGSGSFKFALVDAAGTTTFWSNDGTSAAGSQPTTAVALAVTKGLYSVLLGDATLPNMAAIPASVFNNSDVRLRVWFNDGTHGFQLLAPDQRIVPSPQGSSNTSASGGSFVYGDGSAGDFTTLTGGSTLDASNPQFANFTVGSGATLHIPSGTTIRCTGTFTNNGTIIVDPSGGIIDVGSQLVHRGISMQPASGVRFSPAPESSYSVVGGVSFPQGQLKAIMSIGLVGGGSGGFASTIDAVLGPVYVSARGGGSFRIFALGSISSGSIYAQGEGGVNAIVSGTLASAAGGGGGGGIVILASATSITQSGTIDVSGGNGGASAPFFTSILGNGGGGLIRLLAPVVTGDGQNVVLSGNNVGVAGTQPGSGGGASAGSGGFFQSGSPPPFTRAEVIVPASAGLILIDRCNPTALLAQ